MRPRSFTTWLFSLLFAGGGILSAAPSEAAEPVAGEPQFVTVTMTEYAFSPSHLTFKHGVSYRLHLVNAGKEMHEFTAPSFLKSVEAKNPELLANSGTDIVIQPHETKDFYFIPQKSGHFTLSCADHDWADMTGDITVE